MVLIVIESRTYYHDSLSPVNIPVPIAYTVNYNAFALTFLKTRVMLLIIYFTNFIFSRIYCTRPWPRSVYEKKILWIEAYIPTYYVDKSIHSKDRPFQFFFYFYFSLMNSKDISFGTAGRFTHKNYV